MDAEQIRRAIASGNISQNVAKTLFDQFGFVVIQNVPQGMEFGVDYKSWTVSSNFLGTKLIPPGLHFFFLANGNAPRIGFFKWFKGNDVMLHKWDKATESFNEKPASDEDIERLRENLKNVDQNLGMYPFDSLQNWISLSNHITEKTEQRLRPTNSLGLITGQPETVTKEEEVAAECGNRETVFNVNRTNNERVRFKDSNGLPLLRVKEGFEVRFTAIPVVPFTESAKFRAGIDNTDRLMAFAKLLNDDYTEILAEFQYAFIVFLIAQVFDGFDQWKRLMHLFCSCRGALITQPKFYLDLLMVIFFQVKQCPDDFFIDVLSKDNFLATTLSWFFANIEDAPSFLNPELRQKAMKVKAFFAKKFNRSFDLVDDDEPIVVT